LTFFAYFQTTTGEMMTKRSIKRQGNDNEESSSAFVSRTGMSLESTWFWRYALWYGLCGLIHELAHHVAMHSCSMMSLWQFLQALCRYTVVTPEEEEKEEDYMALYGTVTATTTIDWARHAGWIASLVVYVVAHLFLVDKWDSILLRWASTVTLLEAITTDLLFTGNHRGILFCGNFVRLLFSDPNYARCVVSICF
jgi:hypothetical protein